MAVVTQTVSLEFLLLCETFPDPSCPSHNPNPQIKISQSYTYIRVLTHFVFFQKMTFPQGKQLHESFLRSQGTKHSNQHTESNQWSFFLLLLA